MVVPAAAARIGEDLVGLADFLEALRRLPVARIQVGMVLAGESPIRLFDLLRVSLSRDSQDCVVVAVFQEACARRPAAGISGINSLW